MTSVVCGKSHQLKCGESVPIKHARTISEACNAVHERHGDDECENVIHERVEGFVNHATPRQVCDGLQFVVDEQLRRHHDEA